MTVDKKVIEYNKRHIRKGKPYIVLTYKKANRHYSGGSVLLIDDIDIIIAPNALAVPLEMTKKGKKVSINKGAYNYPCPIFEIIKVDDVGYRLRLTNANHWYRMNDVLGICADTFTYLLYKYGINTIYCSNDAEKAYWEELFIDGAHDYELESDEESDDILTPPQLLILPKELKSSSLYHYNPNEV